VEEYLFAGVLPLKRRHPVRIGVEKAGHCALGRALHGDEQVVGVSGQMHWPTIDLVHNYGSAADRSGDHVQSRPVTTGKPDIDRVRVIGTC
jgi:hypothetical protein